MAIPESDEDFTSRKPIASPARSRRPSGGRYGGPGYGPAAAARTPAVPGFRERKRCAEPGRDPAPERALGPVTDVTGEAREAAPARRKRT